MPRLLADANIEGHLEAIVRQCALGEWAKLWEDTQTRVVHFDDLSLSANTPDDQLWRRCQEEGIVLITGNRNKDSADSLESVIRRERAANSLPVLTISDPDRVMRDRVYLARVAERLIDYLTDIELIRGCGRLYLP